MCSGYGLVIIIIIINCTNSIVLNTNIACFYQAVFDQTLRPLSGRYRRVRSGDEGQRPRVPRGVLCVLCVRRGPVQGRLLRSAGRCGFLSAGLRAAQAPGHGMRSGANVQPTPGGRPPLAVGAQGQAPEEEERSVVVVAHDDGRL